MPHALEAAYGNRHFLGQGVEVLRRLDDATYSHFGGAAGGAPVGVHFRHVLDHYRSFFLGIASGQIDYDARQRDPRLERDREFAIETALGLVSDLGRIAEADGGRPLRVNMRSIAADDAGSDWSDSTLKRELQFLVSHTVHHFALIKELLRQAGVDAGEDFGVAPSTLAHLRQVAACAR